MLYSSLFFHYNTFQNSHDILQIFDFWLEVAQMQRSSENFVQNYVEKVRIVKWREDKEEIYQKQGNICKSQENWQSLINFLQLNLFPVFFQIWIYFHRGKGRKNPQSKEDSPPTSRNLLMLYNHYGLSSWSEILVNRSCAASWNTSQENSQRVV